MIDGAEPHSARAAHPLERRGMHRRELAAEPAVAGQPLELDVDGRGTQSLLVGLARRPAIPICSTCQLGVDAFAAIAPQSSLRVPCDPALIGGELAFQGIKLGPLEPCFRNQLSLSDTPC